MASLTGNSISDSYNGLLKTSDNAAVDGTLKNMTDGEGNATPLSMGTNTIQLQADTIELIEPTGGTNLMQISPTSVYFEGTVDFTNSTVTGIGGGGAAGLVAGTGLDSMRSADSLTATAPTANGAGSISMGSASTANFTRGVAIGFSADSLGDHGIGIGTDSKAEEASCAIGQSAYALGDRSIALGRQSESTGTNSISIGYFSSTDSEGNIAIGWSADALGGGGFTRTNIAIGSGTANNERSVAIGHSNSATGGRSVAISENSNASGLRGIAIGQNAQGTGFNSAVVGAYSQAQAEGSFAIGGPVAIASALNSGAIGRESVANLSGAVAIGYQVTTLWADGTTVNQLAMKNYAAINYADDTAAAAGGVPLGGVYHNAGALRIRIV